MMDQRESNERKKKIKTIKNATGYSTPKRKKLPRYNNTSYRRYISIAIL